MGGFSFIVSISLFLITFFISAEREERKAKLQFPFEKGGEFRFMDISAINGFVIFDIKNDELREHHRKFFFKMRLLFFFSLLIAPYLINALIDLFVSNLGLSET